MDQTHRLSFQVFIEECHRSFPSQLGGLGIVARWIGVIMKRVVDVIVPVQGIGLVCRFQGFFIGWDAGIDALVEPGLVQQ